MIRRLAYKFSNWIGGRLWEKERLWEQINFLKDVLEEKRVASFIRVQTYSLDGKSPRTRKDPISLEDIERRVKALEEIAEKRKGPPNETQRT